jgi:murein DD-endopeptidase MepM/ murein hydrolase activator NlpD
MRNERKPGRRWTLPAPNNQRPRIDCNAVAATAVALALCSGALLAQTAYRYRDANGQWVYTDRAAPSATRESSVSLRHQDQTFHINVDRKDSGNTTELTAVNDCLCVVTFELHIVASGDPTIPDGREYRATLAPGSRQTLVSITRTAPGTSKLRYGWRAALGSPEARHTPPGPYRAPFALGSTYTISQAYPQRYTHTDAESWYAVDIVLPDETPVYAARDGVVINVRHDAFRDALAPVMLDQANVVEILHDDGTIAMYAHLHWDSIRVHIGEHVARGLYIANSGNTGFTSGPHLHFAVIRNTGITAVSVPIEFVGPRNTAVTPLTQMQLTAY